MEHKKVYDSIDEIRNKIQKMLNDLEYILEKARENEKVADSISAKIGLFKEEKEDKQKETKNDLALEEEQQMKTTKPIEETMYYRILEYLKWNDNKTFAEIGRNTRITEKGTKDEIERMKSVKGFGHRILIEKGRVNLDNETKRMPTINVVRLMKQCAYNNPVQYKKSEYKSDRVKAEDLSTF